MVAKPPGWGGGGGEDSHLKGAGMLVVSLRGVNFGFRSHLGCSGQNAIIFSRLGLHAMTINAHGLKIYDNAFKNYLGVKVFDDDVFAIIKSHCIFYLSLCFKMVSFRG